MWGSFHCVVCLVKLLQEVDQREALFASQIAMPFGSFLPLPLSHRPVAACALFTSDASALLIHLAGDLRGSDMLFCRSLSIICYQHFIQNHLGKLLKNAKVVLTPLAGANDYDSGHVILMYMEVGNHCLKSIPIVYSLVTACWRTPDWNS